jgi:hypothetical protein
MVLENPKAVFRKYFSKGLGISQQQKSPAAPTGGERIFSEQAILFLCLLWIDFSSLATTGFIRKTQKFWLIHGQPGKGNT